MSNIDLNVEGMSCSLCVSSIERALQEIGSEGNVSLENATVTVEYNENKLTLDSIKEAIESLGYTVRSSSHQS